MKEFTLRDLIRYNNPCKSCGNTAEFYLRSYATASIGSPIKPQIDPITKQVHFILQSLYKDRLVLVLNFLTNEFAVQTNANDAKKSFDEYKAWNKLVAQTECKRCRTLVTSNDLEFGDNIVKPVKLFSEDVHMETETHKYTIATSHQNKKSVVIVDILNQVTPIAPLTIETRALPLSKFKGPKELTEKLRLLVTFS